MRFYVGHHTAEHQSQYVGDVVAYDAEQGLASIQARNKFGLGDRLQLIHPKGNRDIVVEQLFNKKGEAIQEASGSGYFVKLPIAAEGLHNAMVAKYLS